ncbi:hypothetical protein B0J11DRAFT_514487 [Dendryphion nanum]|uniref:Ecp2 effector protein domain-containing protein n=1 Tax=Dendryphion nanum TaxID=256645 RepID=A0A9P9IYH3_9PLEO|nr:hypothetical protein B0J11DRAFT_514487 [Dendryphion nanum]
MKLFTLPSTISLFALLLSTTLASPTPTNQKRAVVFHLSTEPSGEGVLKSLGVDRWKCHNLAEDGIDNQASWAFVDIGLANGCTLFDDADCKGASVNIAKNNGPVLGPGDVNLADVDFDDKASSFSCY